MITKLSPDKYKSFFEKAVTYKTYLDDFVNRMSHSRDDGYDTYLPLNWQRTTRLDKTFQPSTDATEQILRLERPVMWLLIAEHWCGDVSQSIPVIARLAAISNNHIELRIAYRDANPELMDAHLTDGKSRSIPKLIQLDSDFKITGEWGPRPQSAQALVKQLKSDPATADSYAEALHKWYANDKQLALQNELLNLLSRA
jgi:transcriptional regulator of acetoin/glycerol metabolism